jgi:hypothetical protein
MKIRNLFFAMSALVSAAALAAPADATKTISHDQTSFDSIRNVDNYSFKFRNLDPKLPIYKQDGVTFSSVLNVGESNNRYGAGTSFLATNAFGLPGPVTVSYSGPVLGLTLGSYFGSQTIAYIFNGITNFITIPGDGKTTFLGLDTGNTSGVSVTFLAVKELDIVSFQSAAPEPATWAMMILGFGMVGIGLRRRAKAKPELAFG